MWTDELFFNVTSVMWTMVVGSKVRYQMRTNLHAKIMSEPFVDEYGPRW